MSTKDLLNDPKVVTLVAREVGKARTAVTKAARNLKKSMLEAVKENLTERANDAKASGNADASRRFKEALKDLMTQLKELELDPIDDAAA